MRDLIETTVTYLIAIALIAATFYAGAQWLSRLVEQAFNNLAIATR